LLAVVALASFLVVAGAALAANRYSVGRVAISPPGDGSAARPLPVRVLFGLTAGEENRALRAAPVRSYSLVAEGVVAATRQFARCSLRQVSRRRGVPRGCAKAQVGSGLARGAAGLVEDRTLEGSVACNLRLRLYNIGGGMALRLDGEPPVPPKLGSKRLGCPVPVHLAIRVRTVATRIDGVRSTELRFTLPDLLLHPLDGWEASLRIVGIDIERKVAAGEGRRPGFLSEVGCSGRERTVRVAFVELEGGRSEATRTTPC
jgi:hypothetical protein